MSPPTPVSPVPGPRDPTHAPSMADLLSSHVTDPRLPFLHLAQPAFADALERIRNNLGDLAAGSHPPPFSPNQLELGFVLQLARHLLEMLSRVLVLEMHVADHEGRLGEGSETERFDRFGESLRRSEVRRAILEEYPVLAEQIETRIGQWVKTSTEVVRHLIEDLPAMREHLWDGSDPGPVEGFEASQGDRHRGGRSVVFLTFRSGRRVVYKPRSLAVETAFQELLAWAHRDLAEPFRLLRILDRGSHGWVEHVAPTACESRDEVGRYFARQGRYLALLYALHATDFHFENLIAAGEHPLLVDLESLFHPRLPEDRETEEQDPATRALTASVIPVGLLPVKMFERAGREGVDVSALGAREGQLTPQAVPMWENAGTTSMRLVRRRMPFTTGSHQVRLGDEPVDVTEHLPDLLRGFEAMYRQLLARRDELLSETGPLAAFRDVEIRFVARPTRVYALLLQESVHPTLLGDAAEHERFFDRLRLDLPNRPWLEDLIPHEKEALQQGDIPLFTTRPHSRSLWAGSDDGELSGFFRAAVMDEVGEHLAEVDENDLTLQRDLIRASVATLHPEREGVPVLSCPFPEPFRGDRRGLEQWAVAIGDRLAGHALEQGEEAGWWSLVKAGARGWFLQATGVFLFDGLPGIVLFLAHLGQRTGDDRYTLLAQRGLANLRRQLALRGDFLTDVGAFDGWGGVLYLLGHLAAMWRRPDLLAEARTYEARLPGLIERDETYDVVSGCAGCIGALLAVDPADRPSADRLKLAVACGEHLLAAARPLDGDAVGWIGPIAPRPLTGFSHGAAGIAWALAKLAAASGEERFAEGARRAMAYERSLYSAATGNWPDTRRKPTANGHDGFFNAWCYGSVGIGLGRLGVRQHLREDELDGEIAAAAEAALAGGFGHDHSLNQGDLGTLDFLLQASRVGCVSGLDLGTLVERTMSDLASHGPRCATPLAVESPGLMTGLAGIGYGLLRLAAPTEVPSVLVLESPKAL